MLAFCTDRVYKGKKKERKKLEIRKQRKKN
jgi:hypothetical protein